MSHCPSCHSRTIHRSRTRGRWERWRKEITGKRPYRCRACDWRGWLESGARGQDATKLFDRSTAPDPPNLGGTSLARSDQREEVDLKALDDFQGAATKDGA